MNLLPLNLLPPSFFYDNSAEYIIPAMITLVVIVFIILPLIKFPITSFTKNNAKNPFYPVRNVVGFYANANDSGELCTLETKKFALWYRVVAILLSLIVFMSYLGTNLNFEYWSW